MRSSVTRREVISSGSCLVGAVCLGSQVAKISRGAPGGGGPVADAGGASFGLEAPTKIRPDGMDDSDRFGAAMSISGETILVGAPNDEDPNRESPYEGNDQEYNGSGTAFVYKRSPDGWVKQTRLVAKDDNEGDNFGTDVAISGNTAAVTAPGNGGAVYLFSETNGSWSQQAKFSSISPTSVTMQGGVFAVGEVRGSNTNGGVVHIYKQNGESWEKTTTITPNRQDWNPKFGTDVSFTDGLLAVSAYAGRNANYTGSVYIFGGGDGWTQQARLTPSSDSPDPGFGDTVSITTDRVAVGVWTNDRGGPYDADGGHIFTRTGESSWKHQAWLTKEENNVNQGLGRGIGLSGDTLLIGGTDLAPDYDGKANGIGAALVYRQNKNSKWTRDGRLKGRGTEFDEFGETIEVNDEICAIGAPGSSMEAGYSTYDEVGSVYVFERSNPTPTETSAQSKTAGKTSAQSVASERSETSDGDLDFNPDFDANTDGGNSPPDRNSGGQSLPGFGAISAIAALSGGALWQYFGNGGSSNSSEDDC